MTWNLRLVKMRNPRNPEFDHFEIREVYYDQYDEPYGHCEAALWGDGKESIAKYIQWAQEALEKPILEFDDDDVQE